MHHHPPRSTIAGAGRVGPRHQPRGAGQERQRLLGSAETRSQQLGVELQERHGVRAGHPVQCGLGTHHDGGWMELVGSR